jgi:NAD(P)H-dependent flavin oxidoreductase YrpB (nitropropane dioxygenase family)
MFETRLTKMLGIKYPIVGGAMMSITDADFVAAISDAGGLGTLASIIYQTEEEFAAAIDRVRQLTDKPFAVNLNFFPARFPVSQSQYTEIMAQKGVRIVETSGHRPPPQELCQRFKEAGMTWIHKCTGLRYALKAQGLGADIVTVVGHEMGGATGRYDLGTIVIVPTVVKGVDVPVIGGGGVVDGRSLVAVLALGAEAALMGTRLLLTKECPVHDKLKRALLDATELDTMIVMKTIATHRVWANEAASRCAEMEERGADFFKDILDIVSGERARKVYLEGDLDAGIVSCGQGIGQIHDIPTVKQLFDGITAQAAEVVTGLAKS